MLHIGLVGPKDTITLMEQIANHDRRSCRITSHTYTHYHDIIDIIQSHTDIDAWLFSGQVPYTVAKQNFPDLLAVYPQLNGSSLGNVLLQISYHDQRPLETLSFDTIQSEEVIDFYERISLDPSKLQLLPYHGEMDRYTIIQFHEEAFRSRKVTSCITGLRSVYENLIEKNIPSYRLTPSPLSIKNAWNHILQSANIQQLQASQVAVIHLNSAELRDMPFLKKMELQLELDRAVIQFTHLTEGSFTKMSDEKYAIFTTYGQLQDDTLKALEHTLFQMKNITSKQAKAGIGLGDTIAQAEKHAKVALKFSEEKEDTNCYFVNASGEVMEAFGHPSLRFSTETIDETLIQRLNEGNISIATYSKCLHVQRYIGKGFITANDLANHLDMTTRSARRIISELLKVQLAQVVGEEMTTSKGRPTRLIKILQ